MRHLDLVQILLTMHFIAGFCSSNNVPGDSQLRSLGGGGLWGGGGIVVEAWWNYLCWIWSPFWSGGPKNVFPDLLMGLATADQIENANCNANS